MRKKGTSGKEPLISVALIVDQTTGVVREASWAEEPAPYKWLSMKQAIELVSNYLGQTSQTRKRKTEIAAELVWKPGAGFSSSPFDSCWKVQVGTSTYRLTQDGTITEWR